MQPERWIVYLFKLRATHVPACIHTRSHTTPHSFTPPPAVKPARLPIKTDGMEIIYEDAHLSSRIFNFGASANSIERTQNAPDLHRANSIYSRRELSKFRKCGTGKTFIAAHRPPFFFLSATVNPRSGYTKMKMFILTNTCASRQV